MRYIICGIDPGITSAICALDLNGNIVDVYSSKKFGLESIIEYITKIGRPVIFACDVANPPLLLKKLVAAFNARLVCPKEDMKVGEKQKIVEDTFPEDKRIINLHMRDSCAAAIFAYRRFYDLFDKIDFVLKREGLMEKSDEIKKKLLLGEAESIKDALIEKPESIMLQQKKRVRELSKPSEASMLKEHIKKQHVITEELKSENQKLKDRIEILTQQFKTCGSPETAKLAEARKHTIESLENKIFWLNNKIIDIENALNKKSDELTITKHGELKRVITLDNLSSEQVSNLKESNFGDCLFVKELNVLSTDSETKLNSLNIKIIIYSKENRYLANELFKHGFTLIPKNSLNMIEKSNMLLISKKELDKVLEKLKPIKVEHLIEEHKQRFSK